jgi:hypothetical protein
MKVEFKKIGKKVSIYRKKDKVVAHWNGQKGKVTKVSNKGIHIRGISYNNKSVDGFHTTTEKMQAVDDILKEIKEEKEKKEEKKLEEKRRSGIIHFSYRRGTILSDWTPADIYSEKILSEYNGTEWIGGWGTAIKKWVKELKSFSSNNKTAQVSISDLEEKNSEIEKKKKNKKDKEREIQKRKIKEAKEKNKKIFIKTISGYNGDDYSEGTGWVQINEYATPEGTIITEECPCY